MCQWGRTSNALDSCGAPAPPPSSFFSSIHIEREDRLALFKEHDDSIISSNSR
jgi:hypothetical protein